MNKMIERVAKAIHDSRPNKIVSWEGCGEGWKENMRRLAKAAIEAMREPTEDMLKVGMTEIMLMNGTFTAWQAMIDAALKE